MSRLDEALARLERAVARLEATCAAVAAREEGTLQKTKLAELDRANQPLGAVFGESGVARDGARAGGGPAPKERGKE
jgi:hypothetical protein